MLFLVRKKIRCQNRSLFLICAGCLILCVQCGKKAPPVAPNVVVPPAVKDLKAEVIKDEVRLTWSVPKKGDTVFDGLERFGVYKYRFHSSEETCPGCPIPFAYVVDVKLNDPEPARLEGDRITCHDKIEVGHRYAYKVVAYHKSGGVSKDSNIVFARCRISE